MHVSINQITEMFSLQESFNVKVNPNWKTANYSFLTAIWTEAAEAVGHINWEWWKNQDKKPDINQIKMEIVDIWHFLISEIIIDTEDLAYRNKTSSVQMVVHSINRKNLINSQNLLDLKTVKFSLEDLVYTTILMGKPSTKLSHPYTRSLTLLDYFIECMCSLNMDWDELYKLYIGKNTLNSFRQSKGYKKDSTTYKSIWATEKNWEDNQYLTEYLKDLTLFTTLGSGIPVDKIQLGITEFLTNKYNENLLLK